MAEATTLETLAATTTISPDGATTVVSRQQDPREEKVDEVQTATRNEEEEDLQAEPSQIREVIVDPPEVAACLIL